MQRGGKFCLAGALFGWSPAPGHASPTAYAPDSWREDFLAQADRGVWLGLFRSCKSGRDLSLSTAPKAWVSLCYNEDRPVPDQLKQLAAVREALDTRGERRDSGGEAQYRTYSLSVRLCPYCPFLSSYVSHNLSLAQALAPQHFGYTAATRVRTTASSAPCPTFWQAAHRASESSASTCKTATSPHHARSPQPFSRASPRSHQL